MKRIAVVEDEVYTREELCNMLEKAGYSALAVTAFENAAEQLTVLAPDLVILDLNLPEISGFQICRDLKQKTSIPILVLTSRDQMSDELQALRLGADEYLTKPCRKERLLARIANILKRFEGRSNLLEGQGFLLDRGTYTLYINNTSVILPRNQGKLLEALLAGGNQLVTSKQLCRALWDTTEFIDENALQVNLTRLKKTMANLGMKQKVVAVRGLGYRLEKLALFLGPEQRQITRQHLMQAFSDVPEISSFAMLNAIGAGQTAKALQLFQRQLDNGVYFALTVGLVARQIRLWWQAQALQAQGVRGRALAGKLGQPPFIAEKTGREAASFPPGLLKKALLALSDADYGLKTGQADLVELEAVIIMLANRGRDNL